MKKTFLIICMVAWAAGSCTKNEHAAPDVMPETGFFDFATSQQVSVSVQYPVSQETYMELYTQNPLSLDAYKNYVKNPALEPAAKGYTDAEGRLTLSLRLASADSEIYAYSPSAAAPVLLGKSLDGANAIVLTDADRIDPSSQTKGGGNSRYR